LNGVECMLYDVGCILKEVVYILHDVE